jgi:hypothetical protein
MEFSPCSSLYHRKLYRKGRFAVTLALTLAASILLGGSPLAAQLLEPQYGRKQERDKGPRALGLIQLAPKGKGRLIPIAIMMDGKFYDAGSYKAAPVPMALDFGVVYEAFRSGVSQGVFTITQPGQLNHVWIAEGTWLPAGSKALEKHKKYSAPVIEDDDKNGPPVLHRRAEKTDSDGGSKSDSAGKDTNANTNASANTNTNTSKDQPKTASPAAGSTTATPASAPNAPDSTKASTAPEATKAPPTQETAKASAPASTGEDEPNENPNRPRLRRGKPDASTPSEPYATFDALPDAAPKAAASVTAKPDATALSVKDSAAAAPQIITIPAISDAHGPDPRPYVYDVKPAEEAIYRSKMLDLAATQVHAPATAATNEAAAAPKKASAKSPAKSAAKRVKPVFDEVSLRIFDLSNSNEPVLVLSAKTHPPAPSASGSVEEPQEITLIARTNLEGELRKLFFSETDSRHLDIAPRMELIDAIDADGDGRGELLFRRSFDTGSAYAIYRVTADGLWTLFEGVP